MQGSSKESKRRRLLEAAAAEFAEQGFRNTRVRDVCRRAGANVAAVNYYFGDKQSLYDEVLRHAFGRLRELAPDADPATGGPPEALLRSFVANLLRQLLVEDADLSLFANLIGREMVDPTEALERLIGEGIQPQVEYLLGLLHELVGDSASDQELRRTASSVLGQCIYYFFARRVIEQLRLEEHPARDVEAIADHIARFSVAGIRGLA